MTETAPWFDQARLLAWLKLDAANTDGVQVAELCRLAAAKVVEQARPDLGLVDAVDASATPDDVHQGAVLLAARLYARKGSPQGIATFGELGASTILRSDPDIGLLLGVDRYAKPYAG